MRWLATSVFLAVLSPIAFASEVWVVGSGGVASIGDAIALAADGDVVLVRAGTYPGFTVTAKSLVIVGDTGPQPTVQGSIMVSQLGVGQAVTLQGLDVLGSPDAAAVQATDNLGSVWIEDCSISGAYGGADPLLNPGIGLRAEGCASLVVRRSTIVGADAPWELGFEVPGADGALLSNCEAEIFSCSFLGGRGGAQTGVISCSMQPGGTGGAGLWAEGSKVLIQTSGAVGGNGGNGAKCDVLSLFCGDGGDAGYGLVSAAASEVSSVLSGFLGGVGGAGGWLGCPDGAFGGAVLLLGGTFAHLPAVPQSLTASSPLREGELAVVVATGQALAPCAIYASLEPAGFEIPSVYGSLLLQPPLILLGAIILPADGQFQIQAPVPELGAAVAGLTLRVQTAVLPISGGFAFGEAATLVFLDVGL